MAERASRNLVTEPGLIASVGRPQDGAAPVSLVAYPADGGPSDLDALLDEGDWETDALLAEARDLRLYKTAERLGRTNLGAPAVLPPSQGPWVLVVDRTDDEAFLGARPEPGSLYCAMLHAARRENPHARIVIWREQAAQAALGRLPNDLTIIEGETDAVALVQSVEAVYTVGALCGLEALLVGRRVVCFGRPFYAGRGLTDDRAAVVPRRKVSVDVLFAAAYLLFPRYRDPLTGEACTPRLAFRRLAAMTRHARRVRGDWRGLNLPLAKHGVMRAFLGGPMSRFGGKRTPGEGSRLVAWASRPNDAVRSAIAAGHAVTFVEDGFLRSVGLGSSFHPASSLILDERGVYYDPSRPSDLAHMLCTETFDGATLAEAADLRARIVALGLSKYNLAGPGLRMPSEATGRRTILVPGQVANDASVITGGADLSNLEVLQRVRRDNPAAFVVYKPHPDVVARQRPGALSAAQLAHLADLVVPDGDIAGCIEAVDEVHTLTSLAGFEALLRGRAVTCYGWPFYAGWGLTTDRGPQPAPPRRPVTLDALVAACLIRYPLYLDPVSWLPCDADAFVSRLAELRRSAGPRPGRRIFGPFTRYATAVRHILVPPRPPVY